MELFTPDFGLIFWMFVAFAILFFALYKWGWPMILKSVESRADLIDKGVEYAQNAKEQLDNARQEAKKVMDAAKVSIEQDRKQAEQELRNQVSAFALAVADKVVRNEMKDDKAQQRLVDTLIKEMETQN